jgi:hypothetical protein
MPIAALESTTLPAREANLPADRAAKKKTTASAPKKGAVARATPAKPATGGKAE